MKTISRLKGGGYLSSTASVILLAIPAFKSASESKALLICLLLGMATSIAGMALRWRSHRREQREKDAGEARRHSTGKGIGDLSRS